MATEPVNEQTQLRTKPEIRRSVIIYRRVYHLPKGTAVPGKGDAVSISGVSGSGINQPRVMDVHTAQQRQGGLDAVTITYYQIRAYA